MLTDQDIFNRYQEKLAAFNQNAEITLLGHSLFDMWGDVENIEGKNVANLGISGVSARQYLDVIIKPERIKLLGDDVFIFLGVNDIVKEQAYTPEKVVEWLNEISQYCKKIAPTARLYWLEATPVNNIATTDNPAILQMNHYLEQHCPTSIRYVKTWQDFVNDEGKLKLDYCVDGLHFSDKGYAVLRRILANALQGV